MYVKKNLKKLIKDWLNSTIKFDDTKRLINLLIEVQIIAHF
jgi:hypothetical protein